MNYQQALAYIESYTDYEKTPLPHAIAHYDLRRVYELLERLGNPHLIAKSVHITGTKGKGSTSAMVAAALTASGYITGLYTSPHLLTIRERFQVDGEPITEEEFASLMELVKPEAEAVNQRAAYGQLTTFEVLTALCFAFFRARRADFQVLEVGMGGTFDATNVIQPEVCVLTSISLDHTEILGDTLSQIATEKCGIIKPGCTVVTSPQTDEAYRVIETACGRKRTELVRVGTDVTWESLGFDVDGQRLRVKGRLDSYELTMALLGEFQLENAAVSVAALEVLVQRGFKVSKESIITGLAQVNWPGRFQLLGKSPFIMIDGAHNPYSAQKLRESIEQFFPRRVSFSPSSSKDKPAVIDRRILVIGTSSDKDIVGIVAGLYPAFDKVIITRSRHPRAMSLERIVAEFKKHGVEAQVAGTVAEALSLALSQAKKNDLICVTGSLFVIGEVLEQRMPPGGLPKKS
jgi:dihydrofolate synthase/folylpolyglutamate synthase